MLQKLSDLLKKTRKDERGFTLIELLVVILIIGILSAIALPAFLGQAGKGAKATGQSNLRSAVTKVEACAAENGDYLACVGTSAPTDTKVTLPGGTYPVTSSAESATGYTLNIAKVGKLKSAMSVSSSNGNVAAIQGGD